MESRKYHSCFTSSDKERDALIDIVKQYPFLYDPRDEDFLSFAKKQRTWTDIGSLFNISGDVAIGRWRGIKDRYFYVKRRESLPVEWVKNNTRIRRFNYYEKLSFLDDCIQAVNWNPLKERLRNLPPKSRWTKLHTSIFIEELQGHPLLYDTTHPLYFNEEHRHEALRTIFGKLRPFISHNMTPQYLERKIRELKFQYHKEKICIKAYAKDLKHGEPPYEPKLWCFDRLGFLEDNVKGHPAKFPVESEVEIEPSGDERCIDNSNDPFNSHPFNNLEEVDALAQDQTSGAVPLKCSKIVECLSKELENAEFEGEDDQGRIEAVDCDQTRSMLHKSCSRLLESLANKMETHKSDKNNGNLEEPNQTPHTLLRQMVESELSTVSEHIFGDAKREIIQVLKEASKKNLREKTQASLPTQQTKVEVPPVQADIYPKENALQLDLFEVKDEQINCNFSFM